MLQSGDWRYVNMGTWIARCDINCLRKRIRARLRVF
jgi:hypothetical protein